MTLPACGDFLCPLDTFMEILKPVLESDFESECNHDSLYPDSKWYEC